jgi:site-specific DNA recombinase
MSSPDLLRAQAERCLRKQHDTTTTSAESSAIEAELTKLRTEEDRYAKAYGAGLFNVDQLKAYAAPIRARIAALERELPKAGSADSISTRLANPESIDIDRFASEVADELHNLKFEQKRAIVSRVINKVVGTQKELRVSGCLPIPTHVEYQPNDRYRADASRLVPNENSAVLPFEFTIELPAPNYQTVKQSHNVRAAA